VVYGVPVIMFANVLALTEQVHVATGAAHELMLLVPFSQVLLEARLKLGRLLPLLL